MSFYTTGIVDCKRVNKGHLQLCVVIIVFIAFDRVKRSMKIIIVVPCMVYSFCILLLHLLLKLLIRRGLREYFGIQASTVQIVYSSII